MWTGGQSGVFDLDELCALLRNDNARDICAISISPELKYVDYLVLATGRSTRHLLAMAEYIQWAVSFFQGRASWVFKIKVSMAAGMLL